MRRGYLPVKGARSVGILFCLHQFAIGDDYERLFDRSVNFGGEEIVRMIEQKFAGGRQQIELDVEGFLEEMQGVGLITVSAMGAAA